MKQQTYTSFSRKNVPCDTLGRACFLNLTMEPTYPGRLNAMGEIGHDSQKTKPGKQASECNLSSAGA